MGVNTKVRRASATKGVCFFIAAVMMFTSLTWSGGVAMAKTKATKGRVDALSYKMALELNTKKDRLYETVYIKLKNRTNKTVKTLYIRDMNPEIIKYAKKNYGEEGNKKKRTKLKSVTCNGKKLKIKKNKTGSLIKIKLGDGDAIGKGSVRIIEVKLYTDIPNRQDRFAVQKIKKGKLYALSFCFPYLADNKNGKWNKDPFYDDGESRSADIANYSVKFKAPKNYKVAATGREKTKKTGKYAITTIKAKRVRDFAIVTSNHLKKETFNVNGIKVRNFYLDNGKYVKQYRKLSKMVAKDSIKIYTKKIGKYPYKELDIAQCLFGMGFGGMEYPRLVMTNGSTYYDGLGPVFGAQALAEGLSHEIGHQWFYAAVGNNEYRAGWIDEGFTTLLEAEYYGLNNCASNRYIRKIDKDIMPIKEYKKYMKEELDFFKSEYRKFYINIPSNKMTEERGLSEVYYNGGHYFLKDVKRTMGTKKFGKFMKAFYKKIHP